MILIVLWLGVMISCNDEPEEGSLIYRKWKFVEAGVQVLTDPSQIEVTPPNITDLYWTFLRNDSLMVESPAITSVIWSQFDPSNMRINFENEYFYEVLKLTTDSLNIRHYEDLGAYDFYILFKLVPDSN